MILKAAVYNLQRSVQLLNIALSVPKLQSQLFFTAVMKYFTYHSLRGSPLDQ
jgi:hypothetical protein